MKQSDMPILFPMDQFFAERVVGYDAHMLDDVAGCRNGYMKMAQVLSERIPGDGGGCRILDLGCGTGLELDEIWKLLPAIAVTGIDMTREMLDQIRVKHPDKETELICGSYFDVPFAENFDGAVSFQTMHHFSHEKKLSLYRKIFGAVKPGGVYIECDYMVEDQTTEDALFAMNDELRKAQGIDADAFYHFDTPCTVENQIRLLNEAGFSPVSMIFREENTTMLIAEKQNNQ